MHFSGLHRLVPEFRGNITGVWISRSQGSLRAGTRPGLVLGDKSHNQNLYDALAYKMRMTIAKPSEYQTRRLRSRDVGDIFRVTQQTHSNVLLHLKVFQCVGFSSSMCWCVLSNSGFNIQIQHMSVCICVSPRELAIPLCSLSRPHLATL